MCIIRPFCSDRRTLLIMRLLIQSGRNIFLSIPIGWIELLPLSSNGGIKHRALCNEHIVAWLIGKCLVNANDTDIWKRLLLIASEFCHKVVLVWSVLNWPGWVTLSDWLARLNSWLAQPWQTLWSLPLCRPLGLDCIPALGSRGVALLVPEASFAWCPQ